MKIAVINDTHWGGRNDNAAFANHLHKFYDEVFFPTLKEQGVTAVFHLGDVFDRRKYVNFVTARNFEKHFVRPCYDNNIQLYMVAGNHDTFYKNTNEVNSIRQLYEHSVYDNVHLYWEKPVELDMDGCKIVLAPWICPDNYEASLEVFENTSAQILMGHFEISGYEMMKGHLCDHGLDRKLFKKFDAVYSGHFHHPSSHGNITYLGAPYEMNWGDYDQVRGFSIFDTDTREMTHVRNPLSLFHKLLYNDEDLTVEDIQEIDTSVLTGTYIKVIVQTKENPYLFDLFLDKVQAADPADIKVVDDHRNLDIINEDDLVDEAQDTLTILKNYIANVEFGGDKVEVEKFLGELYQEAMSLE